MDALENNKKQEDVICQGNNPDENPLAGLRISGEARLQLSTRWQEQQGHIVTESAYRFGVDNKPKTVVASARAPTNIGVQGRHVTPLAFVEHAITDQIACGIAVDAIIKDILYKFEQIYNQFLVIESAQLSVERNAMIDRFFAYLHIDPSRLTGIESKQVAEDIGALIFTLYNKLITMMKKTCWPRLLSAISQRKNMQLDCIKN